MNKIVMIVNSNVFRRIMVIFLVGFITRCIINYVYDINVFKEYSTIVSLMYYGFMAGFSGFVYVLPKISLSIFDRKLIGDAIKMFFEGSLFGGKDKMVAGDMMFTYNINKSKEFSKETLVLKQENSDRNVGNSENDYSTGVWVTHRSAGARALYERPGKLDDH